MPPRRRRPKRSASAGSRSIGPPLQKRPHMHLAATSALALAGLLVCAHATRAQGVADVRVGAGLETGSEPASDRYLFAGRTVVLSLDVERRVSPRVRSSIHTSALGGIDALVRLTSRVWMCFGTRELLFAD